LPETHLPYQQLVELAVRFLDHLTAHKQLDAPDLFTASGEAVMRAWHRLNHAAWDYQRASTLTADDPDHGSGLLLLFSGIARLRKERATLALIDRPRPEEESFGKLGIDEIRRAVVLLERPIRTSGKLTARPHTVLVSRQFTSPLTCRDLAWMLRDQGYDRASDHAVRTFLYRHRKTYWTSPRMVDTQLTV
jgi:hypothetical protein